MQIAFVKNCRLVLQEAACHALRCLAESTVDNKEQAKLIIGTVQSNLLRALQPQPGTRPGSAQVIIVATPFPSNCKELYFESLDFVPSVIDPLKMLPRLVWVTRLFIAVTCSPHHTAGCSSMLMGPCNEASGPHSTSSASSTMILLAAVCFWLCNAQSWLSKIQFCSTSRAAFACTAGCSAQPGFRHRLLYPDELLHPKL